MDGPASSVPADRGENRGGHHSGGPEIRAQPLDGAGLRLHHGEEGTHSAQRIFPLLDRGRFHPEEPDAERPYDEESQLPSGTGYELYPSSVGKSFQSSVLVL